MALGLLRHCFGDKLNGPSLTHLAPMQSLKQSHFQGEKLRLKFIRPIYNPNQMIGILKVLLPHDLCFKIFVQF